ncbi:MAG: hypothetical protein KF681_07500 [Bdellovibrionaceae bacterium]|nr:hypothetical protein [Pseudobdellovibrionaceae bacterium]
MKPVRALLFISALGAFAPALAYNHFLCKNAAATPFNGWVAYPMGLLQIGDCALIDDLRFETGFYFYSRRTWIRTEVESGIPGPHLVEFVRALGCNRNFYTRDLANDLIKNKNEVFGPNFESSSRKVTLEAKKIIETDLGKYMRCKSEQTEGPELGFICRNDDDTCVISLQVACKGFDAGYPLVKVKSLISIQSEPPQPEKVAPDSVGLITGVVVKDATNKFSIKGRDKTFSLEEIEKSKFQVIFPEAECYPNKDPL